METNGPTHKLGLCSIDVIEKKPKQKKAMHMFNSI